MIFSNKPPRWDEKGREPNLELQREGFKAGYKPPAPFFNYLFNKLSAAIGEVQTGLSNVDNTADIDKPISTAQKEAIENNTISATITGNPISINDAANAPFNNITIHGASEQIITPSPDYPQVINSVGDNGNIVVKSCNKNLVKNTATTQIKNGITFTVNNDGTVVVNGTATADASLFVFVNLQNALKVGEKYILNGCPSGGSTDTYYMEINHIWYGDTGNGADFTYKTGITGCYIIVRNGITVTNEVFKPMIRLASIENDTYEPHTGTTATVPISEPLYSIGSIKNKIGLKEIVKSLTSVIFDGSTDEDWHFNALQASGKYSYYVNLNNAKSLSVALCSAFVYTSWYNNPWEINKDICSITGDGWFYVYTDFSTIEELREYLANKPITVIYELAEVVTTELTTEQLLALQSLQTYEGITNVFADDLASLDVDYFKNTTNGKAASLLKAENNMLWKTLGDVNNVLESLIGGA